MRLWLAAAHATLLRRAREDVTEAAHKTQQASDSLGCQSDRAVRLLQEAARLVASAETDNKAEETPLDVDIAARSARLAKLTGRLIKLASVPNRVIEE